VLHDDLGLVQRILRGVFDAQSARQELLQRCPGRNPRHRIELLVRMERVRRLLDSNFRGSMSLAQMAALARMSRYHFIRVFARLYGVTPHQLLAQRQLELAQTLLGDRNTSVDDVARAIGYDSRSSFTRWIKTQSGRTPSQLRDEDAERSATGDHASTIAQCLRPENAAPESRHSSEPA
jgi:AraC-like DNA-binding protein